MSEQNDSNIEAQNSKEDESDNENISKLKEEIESYKKKTKKLWKMNEVVYIEKKKTDDLNEMLLSELDKSESEKTKFREKNSKLWAQSVAIHKEKERIDSLKKELEHRNKEITDSINYAKRIQAAILPSRKFLDEVLIDYLILYKPKDIVAGDFYWLEEVTIELEEEANNEVVLFAAADCTGHGVPGAMVSVICVNGLNRSVREYEITDPGKILDKTREIVIQEFEKSEEDVKDGMDISLCYLDRKNNLLKWSGANNPIWIIRSGELIETKANKQPIGKYSIPTPFTTHEFHLEKGDLIYTFTDGFQDQFGGERGKKFKPANFKSLLLSIAEKPLNEQKTILDKTIEDWKGGLEQVDDICIIGLRV